MGVIQDLRDADITVTLVGDVARGRDVDISKVVFFPTRSDLTRAEQITLFEANDDVMALVDNTGRMHLWRVGPVPAKRPDHPNQRRSAHVGVMADNATRANWTPRQRQTVTTAAPVMRAAYGAPGPDRA